MTKVRKLKYHEQKLLKKVDFLAWKSDKMNEKFREHMLKVIAKYKLKGEKEFFDYQRIANQVNETIKSIKELNDKEHLEFKKQQFEILSNKLYEMGVLDSLNELESKSRINVERFCRRRLSYMVKVLHLAETVNSANEYITHGHIRVGPEIVKDPAFIVSRGLEDFITWSNTSKIKHTIKRFNEEYDDYEMLNA